ncbi:MAG: RDD family protein [Thermosulfidibacteraceae bacterium]|jgi:uncharacterized RDD family membrane protein YckC
MLKIDLLFKRATVTERFFAFLIDVLFVNMITKIITVVTPKNISFLKVFLIYYFSFTYGSGSTIGKFALSLKSIQKDLGDPKFINVLIKTLTLFLTPLFDIPSKISGIYTVKSEKW